MQERHVSIGGAEFLCRVDRDGRFWVLQGRQRGKWDYYACFAPGEPVVRGCIYVPVEDRAGAARELERVRQEMMGGDDACAVL